MKKKALVFLMFVLLFPFPGQALTKRGLDKEIGLVMNLTATHETKDESGPTDDLEVAKKGFLNLFNLAYGKRVIELKAKGVTPGQFLQSTLPLFYAGAESNLDHILEITGDIKLTNVKIGKKDTDFRYALDGKVRVVDLATLKVTGERVIKMNGKGSALHKAGDPSFLVAPYEYVAQQILPSLTEFYNPNIMEKVMLRKVADFFFEKEQCERAGPIYEKAMKDPYDIDILDQMSKRITQCKQLIGTQTRLKAKYRLDLEFQGLSETYQAYFKNAAAKMNLAGAMEKYTDKPVTLRVTSIAQISDGEVPGEFLLTLVYDPHAFAVPKSSRVTETEGYVDLSAFNGPILELNKFKAASIQAMNEVRKDLFARFTLRLRLENYSGDWLTYLINIGTNQQPIAPKEMELSVKGYKPVTVEQKDDSFRNKNQFALGPAFTIDGKETTSNVVYKFFAIQTKR